MRLDKRLCGSGLGTRSEIKKIVKGGHVSVNGHVATDPGMHISSDDVILFDGTNVIVKDNLYYMLDKPDGVLTAMEDKRLPTVTQFVPPELTGRKLSPVGRLDYHTTGLLILTNDGELSHRLTSPKYNIPKVYRITYSGSPLTDEYVRLLDQGITLTDTDNPVKLKPSHLELTGDNTCELTLFEGKTHEVRRIIASFGRCVEELRRIQIGNIILPPESRPGNFTEIPEDQIYELHRLAGLEQISPSP